MSASGSPEVWPRILLYHQFNHFPISHHFGKTLFGQGRTKNPPVGPVNFQTDKSIFLYASASTSRFLPAVLEIGNVVAKRNL